MKFDRFSTTWKRNGYKKIAKKLKRVSQISGWETFQLPGKEMVTTSSQIHATVTSEAPVKRFRRASTARGLHQLMYDFVINTFSQTL